MIKVIARNSIPSNYKNHIFQEILKDRERDQM